MTQETPQDSLNCNYFYSKKMVNILQPQINTCTKSGTKMDSTIHLERNRKVDLINDTPY